MTDAYQDSPPLTDEQLAVVEQPWDARVLVTAGAGAGKTHTLVRRLDALCGHEDPEQALEAAEILVLTFSRAAARELRERISRHGERAHRVRARTFDAWAYEVLLQAHPDSEWGEVGFDERIAAATRAIEKGALEIGDAVSPAHVVIDEVQDLLGGRRELVETLLDRYQDSCGFTVVGDAAQSVYGFQIADLGERADETGRFFDWLRCSYPDDLVELRLTQNFRATTAEARVALAHGPLLQQVTDPDEAGRLYDELRDLLLDPANGLGDLDDEFTLGGLRDLSDTCAVLTRDNQQALVISGLLHAHGIDHRLRRPLEERPVPYWVAELLRRTEATGLTEDRFSTLLSEIPLPYEPNAAALWTVLRRVARGAGRGVLDLDRLRRAVADGRFPDEVADPETSRIVLSTVHRAKGLEFDRVIVLTPPTLAEFHKRYQDELDLPAEARALYVAMTRARQDLYHAAPPQLPHFKRAGSQRHGRRYLGSWRSYDRYGIVAEAGDVCRDNPPGHQTDAVATQAYLLEQVRPGQEVLLRKRHDLPMSEVESPTYALMHDGKEIGEASQRFREDLFQVQKVNRAWDPWWPDEIHDLRIDTLETVTGSTAAGTNAGLGERGVWIAPRITGIGRFRRADDYEEQRA
ncbi:MULTISPECIES: UvrD-helicase domain-containing protein [unclassified Streptomyces]|uniref:UvrD-helicase domain-containing protein n=1 Tax=unclassified Streptomyces TaxID=2593676 RepID=UPI001163A884|nr:MULTISPECIES: UvrD-helicase domain-containing protein [unclassified Streptomyces]QDN57927.1 ATP-dependent helicase [Streptomyces sp. S1D4-20]QDN68023.1 ATP-dependent helicase [Streptomyces sp. S1D4-14]QDO50438.1 ATP-dependent helicase [Streptomyces sp. RLB3-5]QDO60679.1 ATP-dependent helicase [Streptomyces sp. RLB1-8]